MNDTSMNQMLSDGKYDMLFDALATDSFLGKGFAKFLLLAELHRVSRFSQQAISTSHLDLIGKSITNPKFHALTLLSGR